MGMLAGCTDVSTINQLKLLSLLSSLFLCECVWVCFSEQQRREWWYSAISISSCSWILRLKPYGVSVFSFVFCVGDFCYIAGRFLRCVIWLPTCTFPLLFSFSAMAISVLSLSYFPPFLVFVSCHRVSPHVFYGNFRLLPSLSFTFVLTSILSFVFGHRNSILFGFVL